MADRPVGRFFGGNQVCFLSFEIFGACPDSDYYGFVFGKAVSGLAELKKNKPSGGADGLFEGSINN